MGNVKLGSGYYRVNIPIGGSGQPSINDVFGVSGLTIVQRKVVASSGPQNPQSFEPGDPFPSLTQLAVGDLIAISVTTELTISAVSDANNAPNTGGGTETLSDDYLNT